MIRTAPAGVTAANLTAGMKVRRAKTDDEWRTVTTVRRDGPEILITFEGTVGQWASKIRDRWEVAEAEDPGALEPDTTTETALAGGKAPAEVCPQCGRETHRCADCGNEYDRAQHYAYSVHIDRAHTRTDGLKPLSRIGNGVFDMANGDPAAVAGDREPLPGEPALDEILAAHQADEDARGGIVAGVKRGATYAYSDADPEGMFRRPDGGDYRNPHDLPIAEPVEIVEDTPQRAAARIVDAERIARKLTAEEHAEAVAHVAQAVAEMVEPAATGDRPDAFLEVYVYQSSAAVTITNRDGSFQWLTDHPVRHGIPQVAPALLGEAERLFDDVAGWFLTPGGRWSTAWDVENDQSVAIVARRGISRTRPQRNTR